MLEHIANNKAGDSLAIRILTEKFKQKEYLKKKYLSAIKFYSEFLEDIGNSLCNVANAEN
jgi:hypothetical protein